MKTILELEKQLELAKQKNLIRDYEHIKNRDMILVKLNWDTTEKTIMKLKLHIHRNYQQIFFITTTPHDRDLYIRYSI